MRTLTLTLAAAGAALAFAAPASAQYYPSPYQQPQGYGYGYNNHSQVRQLQYRINSVQRQIRSLDRYNRIGDRSANRLKFESRRIEDQLRRAARYGLNPQEAYDINRRIAQLEQRIQWAMNSGGRYGNGYYGQGSYGYGNYQGHDRDGDDDNRWDGRHHDRDDDGDDD